MALALDRSYTIAPHPHHQRLRHVSLAPEVVRAFLADIAPISVQELEYVPYMRFVIGARLADVAGATFASDLNAIIRDRSLGGFTIGIGSVTHEPDELVKFGTAVSHLIGRANFDSMMGTYYARFVVQDTDESDSYLRQAYRTMTLHTDGTYVDEVTNWLLMMKFAEKHAVGGETRVLHLDDWEELDRYASDPLAKHRFLYKSPPSKNVGQTMHRTTFFDDGGRPGICFIDQFAYPESIEQAAYLHGLSSSMERSTATIELPLPVGDLIMLNNAMWVHGRAAFQKDKKLHRELMRQRGSFS